VIKLGSGGADVGNVPTTSRDADLAGLPDHEVGMLLEQLEREERALSRRRNALQNRVDFLLAGGFASGTAESDDLGIMLEREREISDSRRDLHRQIDELRAEISRRRVSD
jgi:hypothetical protein